MRQTMKLTGEVTLEQVAHVVLVLIVVEKVFGFLFIPQALMHVARAARQVFGYLSHKSGYDAMLVGNFLGTGLKQHGTVSGLQGRRIGYGCFVHTGTGFGMQPLSWHVK